MVEMNDYSEFDKGMSQICKCTHLRGEHEWNESLFKSKGFDDIKNHTEPCVDNNCNCKDFEQTHDEKIIEKANDRMAEMYTQDEGKK